MMHILITNDDGVSAPGLLALAQELRKLGKVTVIAPENNWSASGHTKTIHRPLRVEETALADGFPAWTTDGSPSDCVGLAVLGFLPDKVDVVLSGINPDANLGQDVTYSGTVMAAMEAAIWKLPGIAVSLDVPENHQGGVDFAPAARLARQITSEVMQHGLLKSVFLNVNIPYLLETQLSGISITRLGRRIYQDVLDSRRDPRGRPYYWIGGEAPTGIAEEGTDFGALERGSVSITPLHLDLTSYPAVQALSGWNLILEPPESRR
jgi:5'-nucleotidase